MDIKCSVCGEPWDMDTIHEVIADKYPNEPWKVNGHYVQAEYDPYYAEVKSDFFKRGCEAFGSSHGDFGFEGENQKLISALYSEFGDDLDGCASILDDMGMM